jgi:hypothetical protein
MFSEEADRPSTFKTGGNKRMRPPPTVQTLIQPAAAGVVRKKPTRKLSSRVKVVNSVSNGSGDIRRRDAEFFLSQGRAVHVGRFAGQDHIRLVENHPLNRTAALRAANDERRSFEQNRRGIVFWNGHTGPGEIHSPGEVVS